jgi:glycosyltransferase involved in cell wall biosynthesis
MIDGLPCYIHHTPRPSYLTFPAKLSKILMDTDVDLVHSHSRIGLPISRLGFKRIHLAHLHGLPYSATEAGYGTSTYDLEAYAYMRAFLGEVDFVVCYCDGLARRVVELFGLSPSKVSVIYNGVDPRICHDGTDGPAFRERIGADESPIVLFVGRAEPIKGTMEFLDSLPSIFREFPEASVVVMGTGWDRLLEGWSNHGRITVIPHLEHGKMGDAYRAADVHVAVTKVYGSQKTTIEAASCGTQVVATDNVDNRRILGDSGIYVDPTSPADISAGVIGALRNGSNARELHQTARRIKERYSWDASAAKCQRLYAHLCDL